MLAYAARRLRLIGALLVLTARDEALQPGHPLQRLLGMLAGEPVLRLELAPLSRLAVGALAQGTGRDAAAVHALTGGNPFFVAEVLAALRGEVPAWWASGARPRRSGSAAATHTRPPSSSR